MPAVKALSSPHGTGCSGSGIATQPWSTHNPTAACSTTNCGSTTNRFPGSHELHDSMFVPQHVVAVNNQTRACSTQVLHAQRYHDQRTCPTVSTHQHAQQACMAVAKHGKCCLPCWCHTGRSSATRGSSTCECSNTHTHDSTQCITWLTLVHSVGH